MAHPKRPVCLSYAYLHMADFCLFLTQFDCIDNGKACVLQR